ncbi:MAG: carotenoid oxygenase family protein [Microcoleus sp. PH2017_16_JOR_D_A]|uniref:carotenoid oxygenase family protein n=1 Tax=Microcoleus sp. PH2017_16_JOR_D_A TaxID=2798827 RepID=UPI001E0C1D8A|nr:carotenoid oxygenase family protein [Microcoleus sp. PH2017_16_JOR_D_A]MCC3490831.1 carotenoid oxygenase family protein [Microcoleus sp. PH2017_16_JOR_D_A]
MKTDSKISAKKSWAKSLARPAAEFPLTQLSVKSGKIPDGLRGTLYRNGPARLERGGVAAGHWFDGDGAILAVHFTDVGATAVYRYVQTAGYLAEEKADRFLYSNYGMTAPGPVWLRWTKTVKNAANTSVLALPDRLLALWEGGPPHSLDLQTLETIGIDNLGTLSGEFSYSAHCKRDPISGNIYNFGVAPGATTNLNLYKSNSTGKVVQKATIALDGIPLIHDFVLAGKYLIFFVPPVRLKFLPVLAGISSYGDSFEWKPELGTEILVVDSETLYLVSRSKTDPWFQWHFANGFVKEDGSVAVDFVRLDDFKSNQRLKEVATGETRTNAEGILCRVHLNPQTGKVIATEELLDKPCEFPIVPAAEVGQDSRYIYLAMYRPDVDIVAERYGAIARLDTQTRNLTIADCGENRYPAEPIYVPDISSEKGWILTVVYDGNSDSSEVWIFDSDGLSRPPVCQLELPGVIPLGFHGTWKSAV